MHFVSTATVVASAALYLGSYAAPSPTLHGRQSSGFRYLNNATQRYQVTSLPEIPGDIGELYAGSIPLNANGSRSLFFMFQPATAPSNKIMTYIEGNPICSAMKGFFGGYGKWAWQPGQWAPSKNDYPWTQATNMLWVDETPGYGFAQGSTDYTSTTVAADWINFYAKFQELFGIKDYKHYMTGGSYAGKYISYMSAAMLDQNDTAHFDVGGNFHIGSQIGNGNLQEEVSLFPYIEEFQSVIQLNATNISQLRSADAVCGFAAWREKYMVYPAAGVQPDENSAINTTDACDVWSKMYLSALAVNPCFNVFDVPGSCPTPQQWYWQPEQSSDPSTQVYFNRADVKKAIHAPHVEWIYCRAVDGNFTDYTATYSAFIATLPRVIEATNRTAVTTGSQDMLFTANGTLLTIQNMTWGGHLGFHQAPSTPLIVEGQGTVGTTHLERGLLWVEMYTSGDSSPATQPAATYKLLQWVLGDIAEL